MESLAAQVQTAYQAQSEAQEAMDVYEKAKLVTAEARATALEALAEERAALKVVAAARRVEAVAKRDEKRQRAVADQCRAAQPATMPDQVVTSTPKVVMQITEEVATEEMAPTTAVASLEQSLASELTATAADVSVLQAEGAEVVARRTQMAVAFAKKWKPIQLKREGQEVIARRAAMAAGPKTMAAAGGSFKSKIGQAYSGCVHTIARAASEARAGPLGAAGNKLSLSCSKMQIAGILLQEAMIVEKKTEYAAATSSWEAWEATLADRCSMRSEKVWKAESAVSEADSWMTECVILDDNTRLAGEYALAMESLAAQVQTAYQAQSEAQEAMDVYEKAKPVTAEARATALEALAEERAALKVVAAARRVEAVAKRDEKRQRAVADQCKAAIPSMMPSYP